MNTRTVIVATDGTDDSNEAVAWAARESAARLGQSATGDACHLPGGRRAR
ncbi:hypothetical protein BJ973_000250 [Actinoplanes tereljensis]